MAKKPKKLDKALVDKAMAHAIDGNGRQLAQLIKSVSAEDLAAGLGRIGAMYKDHYGEDGFLAGLTLVFAVVDGRRTGRAEFQQWMKDARRRLQDEAISRAEKAATEVEL